MTKQMKQLTEQEIADNWDQAYEADRQLHREKVASFSKTATAQERTTWADKKKKAEKNLAYWTGLLPE